MTDRDDAQFDTLLREHLASKLDAQLGRSSERFMRELGETATVPSRMRLTDAPVVPPVPHRPIRLFAWSAGLAGAAIAAGLAVAFVLPALLNRPGPLSNPSPIVLNPDAAPISDDQGARDVEHAVSWRTLDQGTVYLDDEPLRSLVRQQVETVSWYDPKRKAHVQMEIPRDEVMLVGYNSN
jgi:hypothetical protein